MITGISAFLAAQARSKAAGVNAFAKTIASISLEAALIFAETASASSVTRQDIPFSDAARAIHIARYLKLAILISILELNQIIMSLIHQSEASYPDFLPDHEAQ